MSTEDEQKTWQGEALGDGGCLLGLGEPIHTPLSPPPPLFRPRLGQMVGAGKCRRAACFWSILRCLLFPLLPGAMWWLRVSAPRMGSELDLVLPLPFTPSPSLPRGLGPLSLHILAPSSGTTASASRGKGQVPKGALGWRLVTCQQYGESGELELAPHCAGSSAPASASLGLHGCQHSWLPGSSYHCWG